MYLLWDLKCLPIISNLVFSPKSKVLVSALLILIGASIEPTFSVGLIIVPYTSIVSTMMLSHNISPDFNFNVSTTLATSMVSTIKSSIQAF